MKQFPVCVHWCGAKWAFSIRSLVELYDRLMKGIVGLGLRLTLLKTHL